MKKSVLLVGLLLLAGVGLIIYGNNHIPAPSFHGKLAALLPPAPAGWTMTKREIADTPEMKQAVGELLNYDDGVFVDYSNGKERLSVYMAYWTPGKMSPRLVASHTPDVCWVGGGWKKESSETVTNLVTESGNGLPPAEGRLFTAQGQPEYVLFWHMVGGEAKSYATGYAPPWYATITDVFGKGINQREEQFFIRISSGDPLNKPVLAPILQSVLNNLPLSSVAHPSI